MFVEELDDVEAALVDVEVDIAHLEIGRLQGPFPHLRWAASMANQARVPTPLE